MDISDKNQRDSETLTLGEPLVGNPSPSPLILNFKDFLAIPRNYKKDKKVIINLSGTLFSNP